MTMFVRLSRVSLCCSSTSSLFVARRYELHGRSPSSTMRPRGGGAAAPYRQPSTKDPASRSIVLPDSVHGKRNQVQSLTAHELQKRAQRALALQLKQKVLWEGTPIDDAAHEMAQHFLRLRLNEKYRRKANLLIAGGKEFIRELCGKGHAPKHLLIPATSEVPPWIDREKTEIVLCERHVVDEVVPGTDGFVGDFEAAPPAPREHLIANKQRMDRILVLDNVDDPGALGTLLRAAVGFQYDAILLVNHCADMNDVKVVRAARGVHFQQSVPIYQLREEDGDDVHGMLQHVLARNVLSPVVFTPASADDGASPKTGSAASDKPAETSTTDGSRGTSTLVQSLSQFCLESYSGRNGSQCIPSSRRDAADGDGGDGASLPVGHMLIAGPDHNRTLLRRMQRKLSTPPIRLVLDTTEVEPLDAPGLVAHADFSTSLSTVLHALRPRGDWDYLPDAGQQSSTPSRSLSHQHIPGIPIGSDRLLPVTERDLNLTREEQVAAAHYHNTMKKQRRMERYRISDYDAWMQNERRRIKQIASEEQRRAVTPWAEPVNKKEAKLNDRYPNIIDDYRQPLGRDELRREEEIATSYVPPPNYDGKVSVAPTRRR